MERTTIMADEDIIEQLRRLAASRKVSLATVIREALEVKAATYLPKPQSLGVGESKAGRTAGTTASRRQPARPWR
jgi:predicted transcriptional regulator